MTPGGIFDAYKKDITVWGRNDLKDVLDSNLGLKGSPTQIAKASDKVRKGAGEKVVLDPTASVYCGQTYREARAVRYSYVKKRIHRIKKVVNSNELGRI